MGRKKSDKFVIEGAGGAVWELDDLSPAHEDSIAKGKLILISAPGMDAKPEPAPEPEPGPGPEPEPEFIEG